MVDKKGYFFVVDSIIASTILLLGLFYLFAVSITIPEHTQSYTTAEDFATILLYRPLSTSTDPYYVSNLLPNRLVPFPDNTPMEELAYLAFKDPVQCPGCMNNATMFAKSLVNLSLDPSVGAAIIINDTLVYNNSVAKVSVLYNRQLIVYTRMNSTTLVGPVIAEVQIWY